MDQFYLENAARYHNLVDTFARTIPAARTGTVARDITSLSLVVCARIRPQQEDDIVAGFPCAVFLRANQNGTRSSPSACRRICRRNARAHCAQSSLYQVDKLFDSQATTNEIYDELMNPLIACAVNGGIGTLFAYGQTGSGKTFTISQLEKLAVTSLMGGTNPESQREISITIIDLAGNSAYDLLNSRKPVSILEDSFGIMQLVGVDEHPVKSGDEALDLVERAASLRQTASTQKNDASSRSHGVCRIRIRNPNAKLDGFLYLIDLAGSEAARDVAVHGPDRMRETREINMSLSVLKDCIRAKTELDALACSDIRASGRRKPRIPFRQSALTKVLKHVFDPTASNQSCKTVIIACVNPCLADAGPSKNTMRYAEMLRVLVPAIETSA